MKRIIATVAAVLSALVGALVGLVAFRRRPLLAAVAPELRHPLLRIPSSIANRFELRVARRVIDIERPIRPGVELREEHVPAAAGRPAVRVLVYDRPGRPRPSGALLWIHGGGLIMGAPEQYHDVCSRFVDEADVVVVSVDYRLAPEHPFPAGLDDCMAALGWLHDEADRLGIDPARVAVGGDSAGGGLAACVAQRAHDEGGPALCFQLLQYPMLDDRAAADRSRRALVWSNRSNAWAWGAYLGHPAGADDDRPYASAARRTDLAGLPPAWIGIGDIDLFHPESIAYAERLRAAGVPCDLHVVPGMYHGAEHLVPDAPSMQDFTRRMVVALHQGTTVVSN